jgi:hypothetical protein
MAAIPIAAGLSPLGWAWAVGVLGGVGAVAVGRLVGYLFAKTLPHGGRGGLAAGLMGFARQLLVAALAFGGIALGLEPLAVALGLLLPPFGLWIYGLFLGAKCLRTSAKN